MSNVSPWQANWVRALPSMSRFNNDAGLMNKLDDTETQIKVISELSELSKIRVVILLLELETFYHIGSYADETTDAF